MPKSFEAIPIDSYPKTIEAFDTFMAKSDKLGALIRYSSRPDALYRHYLMHTAELERVRAVATEEGFPYDVTILADRVEVIPVKLGSME